MANVDIKTFLEDRLRIIEPTIDLDPGSPAQVQFIEPVLAKLGSDPFETDIDTFITDRMRQEYPDVFAGDISAVRDLMVKPLITLLEPFKREIQAVKTNQSLKDPTVLSDDDADALVANVFDEREPGHVTPGVCRVFYSNPTNVQVEISTRFFTASGLNFYPPYPVSITAEEMVFNRSGALYYFDVPVKAEQAGAEYNIDVGNVVGVDGLFNVVKVTNIRRFTDGSTQIDTPTFVMQSREALTERSLVTPRGGNARIKDVFQGNVRAVQVIGADDVEMQRDILVGSSPGHAWITGRVTLYQNLAFVQARTIDDTTESPVISAGDTLYLYLDPFSYSGRWQYLGQEQRFLRLRVEEPIGNKIDGGSGFQACFVVRWSDPDGVMPASATPPITLEGGLSKKGTLKISSLPSVGKVDLTVGNQEVHVYGHTDIYVRPVLQTTSSAILSGLADEEPFRQRTSLLVTANQNTVADVDEWNPANPTQVLKNYDFVDAVVVAGDLLTIETGDDAGTYVIGAVTPNDPVTHQGSTLVLRVALTKTETSLRYRITKSITVNPFEPKMLKLPFGTLEANDLNTTIGSSTVKLTTDTLLYGVKSGDTLRILRGLDAGDYLITGFDSVLGGRGLVLDRALTSSDSGLTYEIFTAMNPVARPLVRIREMLLLDSSKKSTGIVIPLADPVAVRPTSDFTTARVRGASNTPSGFVLPAMRGYLPNASVAAANVPGNDRRYSEGFDDLEGGLYLPMDFGAQSEFLFPADCMDECSYFLALPEDFSQPENFPPIDPRPGDALTLKNGPNAGSYLVEKVRKFRFTLGGNVCWAYFVKIYGTFPVDVFKELIDFCDTNGAPITKLTGVTSFPDFFGSFLAGLGSKLVSALTTLGAFSAGAPTLEAAALYLTCVAYESGDPARGVLRSYFLQPTLFQQHTADHENTTFYDFTTKTGNVVSFRPDPTRYLTHELVPPRGIGDSDPKDYPRDLAPAGSTVDFTDTGRASAFALGVLPADVLEVYEEEILAEGDHYPQVAIQTFKGQQRVVAPAGASFDSSIVGSLVSIDEGDDAGMYRVTSLLDDKTLLLDRQLTVSTPSLLFSGMGLWGVSAGALQVNDLTATFTNALVDKWLTLYGVPADPGGAYLQGSFRVSSVPDSHTLVLDIGTGQLSAFPPYPYPTAGGYVVTEAPTSQTRPKSITVVQSGVTLGSGTELFGLRPVRFYTGSPKSYPITEVSRAPNTSAVTVEGTPAQGLRQPYRIYRENLRRVNPMEMSEQREGPLYFFDTEVVSLAPGPDSNIVRDSYLVPRVGTYESQGYRHLVSDFTLSYSMKEEGVLEIPTRLLPTFSPDSEENMLHLVGTPVQIAYEQADLVAQLQAFIGSAEDRVTSANLLARHLLPAYVSYDATYSGGSAPSVIAKDIISYVDTVPVQTPIDVSVIQDLVSQRGGNLTTPTNVLLLLHDWDRKVWAEFSENEIGGLVTKVPYHGTPRVVHYIPGADYSGQTDVPPGERINLVRT